MSIERTRQRTLDRAQDLFHREGFHTVGVDRLASEIGISKKTLYKHFGSKENLLAEVVDQCDSMAVADLPDEHDDASPYERVLGIFAAQELYCRQPEFSGCFFVNIATELRDPDNPVVRRAGFHKSQITQYVIRQATLAGATDPDGLAEQLTVIHNGAADYAMLYGRYPATTHSAVAALLTAHGMNQSPGE